MATSGIRIFAGASGTGTNFLMALRCNATYILTVWGFIVLANGKLVS
jgi:hypothetical protein